MVGLPQHLDRLQSILECIERFENQTPQEHWAGLRAAAAPSRALVECEEFVRVNLHLANLLLTVRVANRLDDAAAQNLDVPQQCLSSLTPLVRLQDLLDFFLQRPHCDNVSIRAVNHAVHHGSPELTDARTLSA